MIASISRSRGIIKNPPGHEGGILDPLVSVANITVKEQDGETGTSLPPGQVHQPAFIHAVAEFSIFGHTT